MPTFQNDKLDTLRIKHGDIEIKRVFLGDTLVWGLYEITYNIAGGKVSGDLIKEYVWGVGEYELPKPTWANNTYYTKFNGWYEDSKFITAIPAITKDFHKDLDLYAKWTQRKYTYSGWYTWTEKQWVEDSSGGSGGYKIVGMNRYPPGTYPSPPAVPVSEEVSNIFENAKSGSGGFSTNYSLDGGCTWWCSGRSVQCGGYSFWESPSGYNANQWISHFTNGSIKPGAILCFSLNGGSPGHVAFVEAVEGDTMWVSEAAAAKSNHPNWMAISAQSISKLNSSGTHWWWATEIYQGALANKASPGGGGGGHYIDITKREFCEERDSQSQKPPTDPSPPKSGAKWDPLNKFTYTRNYNYQTKSWDPTWSKSSDNWDLSGDGWI